MLLKKYKEMIDSDWTDLFACDTIDFFRRLHNIYWKPSHAKGHELYKLALPELSSNHTTEICRFIHEVCPVCMASHKGRKKKFTNII
jgi:hypothetical protein